jgi:trans-AT polyketide synthase/acyltransferase/oxidoreductase domain-containing protein
VISGKKKSIEDAQQIFEKAGARMYIPLKVGGAFHSRYMKEASENFRKFLNDFSFSTIKIPVIANITALPYLDNEIKDNLANQICKPVQWLNSMLYLYEFENMLFKEIGDSKVLTNMLKKIPSIFV